MKIVVDLQACQTESRYRGIGRYSMALLKAMLNCKRGHEFFVVLNGAFSDTVESIRGELEGLLPQDAIRVWHQPVSSRTGWRHDAAELLRESFIRQLEPDVIHVASVFEGVSDTATVSINRYFDGPPVAVTHYDLIPHFYREAYLPNEEMAARYDQRLATLAKANGFLTISDYSGRELVDVLKIAPESVSDIAAGVDPMFRVLDISDQEKASVLWKFRLTEEFVLYTGGADSRKNVDGLMAGFAAMPQTAHEGRCLAIVGRMPPSETARLQGHADELGIGSQLRIIDYVDDEDLVRLYNLCSVAVLPSFHEGFGLPLLEAMACGAPAIGSNRTSVPEVLGRSHAMFDPSDVDDIQRCLARVLSDKAFAKQLSTEGVAQASRFTWQRSAECALGMLEKLASQSATGRAPEFDTTPEESADQRRHHVLEELAECSLKFDIPEPLSDGEIVELAACVAGNVPAVRGKQMLIDVSELMINDGKSGIQRVVRSILAELGTRGVPGFDIRLVRRVAGGPYHHVETDAARAVGLDFENAEGGHALRPARGDVFLRLDLVLQGNDIELQRMRDRGVAVYAVVYDLLPVKWPEHFMEGMAPAFHRWLDETSRYADGVICISKAVADEFLDWLDGWQPARARPLKVGWFHLGSDLERSVPTRGISNQVAAALADQEQHSFLMVGTVESRKGYDQVLAAFDALWATGASARLVIVGRQGWLVEELAERLRAHPENGRRLFWLSDVSDEALLKLYAGSNALIMASLAEGFGLPLIEAARHGIRLVARDLPVFREVAGESAYYFKAHDGQGLAEELKQWMLLLDQGKAPSPEGLRALTWSESLDQLLGVVFEGQWYREWRPKQRYFLSPAFGMASVEAGSTGNYKVEIIGQAGLAVASRVFRADAGRYLVRLKMQFDVSVPDRSLWFDVIARSRGEVICREWFEKGRFDADGNSAFEINLARPYDDLQFRLWTSPSASVTFVELEITASNAPAQDS